MFSDIRDESDQAVLGRGDERKDIIPPEPCNIENGGMTLYGWVIRPRNYDPTKKYPAILEIHGGPKVSYGEVYHHEMQMFANAGYFVLFMNPRGSDGRGNDFIEMRGKYGTIDYEDLMKFTDAPLPPSSFTAMKITAALCLTVWKCFPRCAVTASRHVW